MRSKTHCSKFEVPITAHFIIHHILVDRYVVNIASTWIGVPVLQRCAVVSEFGYNLGSASTNEVRIAGAGGFFSANIVTFSRIGIVF